MTKSLAVILAVLAADAAAFRARSNSLGRQDDVEMNGDGQVLDDAEDREINEIRQALRAAGINPDATPYLEDSYWGVVGDGVQPEYDLDEIPPQAKIAQILPQQQFQEQVFGYQPMNVYVNAESEHEMAGRVGVVDPSGQPGDDGNVTVNFVVNNVDEPYLVPIKFLSTLQPNGPVPKHLPASQETETQATKPGVQCSKCHQWRVCTKAQEIEFSKQQREVNCSQVSHDLTCDHPEEQNWVVGTRSSLVEQQPIRESEAEPVITMVQNPIARSTRARPNREDVEFEEAVKLSLKEQNAHNLKVNEPKQVNGAQKNIRGNLLNIDTWNVSWRNKDDKSVKENFSFKLTGFTVPVEFIGEETIVSMQSEKGEEPERYGKLRLEPNNKLKLILLVEGQQEEEWTSEETIEELCIAKKPIITWSSPNNPSDEVQKIYIVWKAQVANAKPLAMNLKNMQAQRTTAVSETVMNNE